MNLVSTGTLHLERVLVIFKVNEVFILQFEAHSFINMEDITFKIERKHTERTRKVTKRAEHLLVSVRPGSIPALGEIEEQKEKTRRTGERRAYSIKIGWCI